ncbi:hypothetical protein, partial [Mesorhizobium sp. M7A.T.Ca.US.000.02.2.1]|uniref:hypothetical protein n=1 Tax=Mesorhizobium sp. M7A.T.Ca.US.000.02.2.1 TaxID=2496793 RepID=UPI001AECC4A6
ALGDDVDNGIADAKHVIIRHQNLRQNPSRLLATPVRRGSSDLKPVCLGRDTQLWRNRQKRISREAL